MCLGSDHVCTHACMYLLCIQPSLSPTKFTHAYIRIHTWSMPSRCLPCFEPRQPNSHMHAYEYAHEACPQDAFLVLTLLELPTPTVCSKQTNQHCRAEWKIWSMHACVYIHMYVCLVGQNHQNVILRRTWTVYVCVCVRICM
jgi:hypothetical protein